MPRTDSAYGPRWRFGPYHRQAVRLVGRRLERIGARLDSWSWGWSQTVGWTMADFHREHITSEECWCAPLTEAVEGGEIVVHNRAAHTTGWQ